MKLGAALGVVLAFAAAAYAWMAPRPNGDLQPALQSLGEIPATLSEVRGPPRLSLPAPSQDSEAARVTVDLVDVPWRYASTGWLVLADYDTPLRDYSFVWGPLTVAGQTFARGISTYPFSEIVYDLEPGALQFSAYGGVTDDSKAASGSVRFEVYGDEFLLWESGVLQAGQPAQEIVVEIAGLAQLRLVVDDAGDGSLGDYALWANPTVVSSPGAPSPETAAVIADARREAATRETVEREAERAAVRARASADAEVVARWTGARAQAAVGAFDPGSSLIVMANQEVAVVFGYGGARNGRLTVYRQGEDAPRILDATSWLVGEDGAGFSLADARPERGDAYEFRRVDDPLLGAGIEALARFRSPRGTGVVVLGVTLLDAEHALSIRFFAEGLALGAVRYFDQEAGQQAGNLLLGERVRYLSDRSHLYSGEGRPDGHRRRAALEATKPALVWSEEGGRGLLFSFFDYVPSPAWIALRRDPARESVAFGLEMRAHLHDFGPAGAAPPALSVELTDGPGGADTFRRFRRVVNGRYPPPEWPPSARYQWGSWYAYGPGVTAAALHRELELISARFADLGPWQFLVDAGWHLQYGRDDAELGVVDFEKFPAGVRGVADTAHGLGFQVILYLGLGFIHDSPADGGEWLALKGVIERHPDWLLPFQTEPSPVRRFLLDFGKEEVRAHIGELIRDYFEVHRADGILVDGLADAEGQLIPRQERDARDGPPHPLLPSLDIYRLIRTEAERHRPNPFIVSGWVNPTAANRYVDMYFYGDEADRVDSPYPFGGFLLHLDYALYSQIALGQRAYAGASSGDPLLPEARWWIQAGAALGAPATLGTRLERMDAPTVAGFRADLLALDPYEGITTYGPGFPPDTFATTRNGLTYLGVVNREARGRPMDVNLGALGLGSETYTALDITTGEGRRVAGELSVELPARSFRMLVLRKEPGVLWTDSVVAVTLRDEGLSATARGPASVPGFLHMTAPPPSAVLLDGVPLSRAASPRAGIAYSYDDASGVLSLEYAHTTERRIEVRW